MTPSASRAELAALIGRVRTRWRALTSLRLWTRAAVAMSAVLAAASATHAMWQPAIGGLALLWLAAVAAILAILVAAAAAVRRAPADGVVARLVEERCPELEDALATAIGQDGGAPVPMSGAVLDDAVRRARRIDLDRVISRRSLRDAALLAAAASVAVAAAAFVALPRASQAALALRAHLFPESLGLHVAPGDVRLRPGESLRIDARLAGGDVVAPVLRLFVEGARRDVPMEATADGFAFTVAAVEQDFTYSVAAGRAASHEYSVTVLRPPRVERIDLRYEFPAGFGMPPRAEEDGGDIYGPAGTRVELTVYTDKPVREAALQLTDGAAVPLSSGEGALRGALTIVEDGSYRVALSGEDGLANPGETEYFIRTLLDRPPDVRIVRPASDRQVTSLEEVGIEARADDDFGIASLDLVFSVAGGTERSLPFRRSGAVTSTTGRQTLFLEDLEVRPGDVVAYYARARDVSRGKRSSEARSDIFFLEVTPFEEEFVGAQSQGAGGGGGGQGLEELIQAEKDIITATWNLDRRGRQAGGRSEDDIRSVARGQRDVQTRASALGEDLRRAAERRRRLPGAARGAAPPADAMAEAIARAVTAMDGARQRLEAMETAQALPHEMSALNELLRAQAEIRRREVQQQQGGAGSGGSNRRQQDLSSLFDRELARQQQTNYETPPGGESRQEPPNDPTAERLRELARRQDALAKSQQELARQRDALPPEELRRQLERLTREQMELRQRAEELARELQQQTGSSSAGGRGGGGQADRQQASRELQQASEEMQAAASELRRDNPGQASARSGRAAERLRGVEQQMRGSQPDERRRALGELQLESRQLAEEQRRLTGDVGRGGRDDADRARQRAAEQDRLADRAQRLEDGVRQLAGRAAGADPDERGAIAGAMEEVDRQRLSGRMRDAARTARQPDAGARAAADQGQRREGEAIARGLERLADRLSAAGGEPPQSQQLSEELSRVRRLREELTALDRQLAQLRDGGGSQPTGDPNGAARGSQGGRQGGRTGQTPADAQAGGRGRQGGRGQQPGGAGDDATGDGPWEEARELLQEMRQLDAVVPADADGFNPGRSAPGTEAWKQDFTRWDELKVQLAAALERAERSAADRLRNEQSRDRLNAGASQAVPEQYRRLVERYYRELAAGTDGR